MAALDGLKQNRRQGRSVYSTAMRPDIERLFAALDQAGVRTIIVGGLAVNLHGHLRMTIDVDLVVDLADEPARRAVETLVRLGYRPSVPVDPFTFADAATRKSWLDRRQMLVLSWFHPDDPLSVVDLFTESPLPFETLWSKATPLAAEREFVRVAAVGDLIRIKRAAGRPRDLEDARALEEIERERSPS